MVSDATDIRIIHVKIEFILEKWLSRIKSFDKNPEENATPLKLKILISIIKDLESSSDPVDNCRASCWENRKCNKLPTIKNKLALANACISRWNKQTKGAPADKDININPNCLKVDRATTFLPSDSAIAALLATKRVMVPKMNHTNHHIIEVEPNRIISQIPAVTKVELWTRALTGVGAAMAAGSQLVKGTCALLVQAVIKNKLKTKLLNPFPILQTEATPTQ